MTQTSQSPAVEAAKYISGRDREEKIVTLKNGVVVKIIPVSATLIDEVVGRVAEPEVPMWHNSDKDRDEPNPNDPKYLRELAATEKRRGLAAMDAMVMFGVELVDEIPEKDLWLSKLKLMEKMKYLDLSAYDIDDPIDREFLYKRYVLSDTDLLEIVGRESGMIAEAVDRAERSFQSN